MFRIQKVFISFIIIAASISTIQRTFAQTKQVYGIGVSFQMDPEFDLLPKVTEVVAATSAFSVGIQKGWYIVAVDGVNIKGMNQNEVVKRIRGKEGTYVKITFAKGKDLKNVQEYIIMRRKLPIKE